MHAQKQHLRKCWDKQQRCKARQQGKTIRDLRKFRHLLSLLEAYVWQLRATTRSINRGCSHAASQAWANDCTDWHWFLDTFILSAFILKS